MNSTLPSAATSDPWPEILHLLPQRISWKGRPVQGDENSIKGFARWMIQQMPAVVGSGDADNKATSFLLWLRSETHYEADTVSRMQQQAQVATAPANPISDQTAPQQAQAITPPVASPATNGQTDVVESGPGLTCPECQQAVSGLRGMKRHVTMTHKTDWPAFCTKHGVDAKTGGSAAATPTMASVATATPPPPPLAQAVPPMFQATGPAQPFVAPAPPPPPSAPQMPSPAPVVAAAPMMPPAGPMVMFDPTAMAQQTIPFQQPSPVQASPQVPAMFPSFISSVPVPAQPTVPVAASAPVVVGGPSRDDLARMLGGAVELILVKLLDAATADLKGRVDVNQLAAVAESRARAEMKVADLAQASYGQGKQAAQRHFAELLTQAPRCYLLLNGYDPIIPDGYLQILAARVTRFYVVTDGGRQVTPIF